MRQASNELTLPELVERTGVPATTIHHYRRLGLLPDPVRRGRRFVYDARHEQAVRLVRLLRERRRLPLKEIQELVPRLLRSDVEAFDPTMWAQAVEAQLADTDAVGSSQRLVDAAIELFATRGRASVGVAEICERAGLAKASFYRHFGSKDEIFVAAADAVAEHVEEAFRSWAAETKRRVSEGAAVSALATRIGGGLPVLLELATDASRPGSRHAAAARALFRHLAWEVGRHLRTADPLAAGSRVIVDAAAAVVGATLRLGDDEAATPS